MNLLAPAALWGFWILLAAGWTLGELQVKGTAVFVLLWLAGVAGTRYALDGMFFTSYVAVLDIALVLAIFKGDVRLH